MSTQQDRPNQEIIKNDNTWVIEGIERSLTPLQYHYFSQLKRLVSLKNSYQTDPDFELWLMNAINKAIYSALRDCMEANIGDEARELLSREHQVN